MRKVISTGMQIGLLLLAGALLAPRAQAQYATRVLAYDATGANPNFTDATKALGRPSPDSTPDAPDFTSVVTVGRAGFLVLGFDVPILPHEEGYDLSVFGGAFYVGGDIHVRFQRPGQVEVAVDDGSGYTPDTVFYRLQGSPEPRWGGALSGVDDREFTSWGYASVTPSDGSADPLVPNDPFQSGIQPGSAGGDAFRLDWAVDAEGNPVVLDHADFVRIRAADARSDSGEPLNYTVVDAVAIIP